MGHASKIHGNVYQQRKNTDISSISKVLETVQGTRNKVNINTSQETQDEEVDNVPENDNDDKLDDINCSEEETEASADRNENPQKIGQGKRRSTQKKRCIFEEVKLATNQFRDYIDQKKLPSLKIIKKLQKEHNFVVDRKLATIKTWVSNQIKEQNCN